MTIELAASLLLAEVLSARAAARGLFLEVTQQMPLAQALIATGAVNEEQLEAALGKLGPPPLTTLAPSLAIVRRLPRGFCSRLLAIPIGTDAETGEIDVALADERDLHAAREMSFFLHAKVRVHRATIGALRDAVQQLENVELAPSERAPAQVERSRTPVWGTPVVSVAPQAPATADMAIPLMRRSTTAGAPPARTEDSAVLELRTRHATPEEPVFALKSPASIRRPVATMVAETQIRPTVAVTIPAPKEDPRHTMLTAPAPPRRSEAPPRIEVELPRRRSSLPRFTSPPSSLGMPPLLPFPDAGPVLAAMEEANDRDAIVALLISGMRSVARRVAVMAVKRDAFVGWSCNAEFGDARAWRSVQVPIDVPSVLATASAGTPYLGPLFRTDGHMPILEFMKETTRDVAVDVVRVDMRPALVLLADELGDTALGTKRLEELAKAAGTALARSLRKK